jgi:filamentous hemagglutinin
VNLNAGADINIIAAQDTHDETHYKKVKQSGLSTSGASVALGSSQLINTNDSQQVTNVASTVGSVEGNVNITSGKTYNQTGSDILTPAGNIDITAQQVNITAATDTYASQQTMKYKQSGITLAITSPILSAIQTVQQMSEAASKTDDPRMQLLAAGTAALAANNAKDALIAGNTPQLDQHGLEVLDANGNNTADNPANQVGGINVSISIGSSKSKSTTTQTSSTAASSTLNAGGNINITATGAGQDSDINVIGSQIKANDDVTLKAEDQINLIAGLPPI